MGTETDARSAASCGPGRKTAREENFPVGSWLIDRRLRPTVMAYYAVARATDDIADDPGLLSDEKIRRLDRYEAALRGDLVATDVTAGVSARQALTDAGVPVERASRLLRAFRRDAVNPRCTDWDDLMAYCADSAAPVGRFLLDLHGEDPSGYPASDALCAALQVINHLQDCRDDYRTLDRVYLPNAWLAEQSVAVTDLNAQAASSALRRVLDRCLDGVDALLAEARPLPLHLRSTRLALEAAAILGLAEALAVSLRAEDPLARRVRLSRPATLWHGGWAVVRCLVERTVSGSAGTRRHVA